MRRKPGKKTGIWSAPAPGWRRLLAHVADFAEPRAFFERVADLAHTPTGGTFTEIIGAGANAHVLIIENVTDADRLGALAYLGHIARSSSRREPVVVAARLVFEHRELVLPLSEIAYGSHDAWGNDVHSEQARILGYALLVSLFITGLLPIPNRESGHE